MAKKKKKTTSRPTPAKKAKSAAGSATRSKTKENTKTSAVKVAKVTKKSAKKVAKKVTKKTVKKVPATKTSPTKAAGKPASKATTKKSSRPNLSAGPRLSVGSTKKKTRKKLLFTAIIPAKEKVLAISDPDKLPSNAQLRRIKSGITAKDRAMYRQRLLSRRAEIIGDMANLEKEFRTDSGDHHSPEHMADIGSNNYEQEFTLGLVESERRIVQEIDLALQRINDKTYGVCIVNAVPIGKARLDAKPWAKYCIQVVREKERRGEL